LNALTSRHDARYRLGALPLSAIFNTTGAGAVVITSLGGPRNFSLPRWSSTGRSFLSVARAAIGRCGARVCGNGQTRFATSGGKLSFRQRHAPPFRTGPRRNRQNRNLLAFMRAPELNDVHADQFCSPEPRNCDPPFLWQFGWRGRRGPPKALNAASGHRMPKNIGISEVAIANLRITEL